MSPEELDAALAALPTGQTRQSPQAVAPASGRLSSAGAAALITLSGRVVPNSGDSASSDREAREAKRREWLRRVKQDRETLEPRIKSSKLAAALHRQETPCALIIGPTGAGKTSAVFWIKARFPGLVVPARDLGACERRHPLGDGLPQLMRSAVSTPVLYLDDLGTEEARDVGVLQNVIDKRYAAGLPTFVTSGCTGEQLSAYLGAAYVRRLIEQHVRRRDGSEWPVLFVDCHGGSA